jgi:hypothetical protein
MTEDTDGQLKLYVWIQAIGMVQVRLTLFSSTSKNLEIKHSKITF